MRNRAEDIGGNGSPVSSKHRALYLTADWPWPPTSGGRVQAAQLVELLSDRYDVTVLAVDGGDSDHPAWNRAVGRIRARRGSQFRRAVDTVLGLAHGRQVLLQRLISANAVAAATEVAETVRPSLLILGRPIFDGFCGIVPGAPLVIEANEDLVRATRSLACGAVSWRSRLVSLVDVAVVGRQQRRNYPRADRVLVCSPIERTLLEKATPGARIRILPNTVVLPAEPVEDWPINAVAFVGSFAYPPNEAAALELVREVMPAVRNAGGPGRAVLIGSRPTRRILRLAAEPDVTLIADASDAAGPLVDAGVLAVPIRLGAGTRVKILNAAALGVPVVSTRFGIEGLDFEPGREVLLAESPDEFAKAIRLLQTDPDRRRAMTDAARRTVERAYSRESARAAMSAIMRDLRNDPSPDGEPAPHT